jgi:uncharacterized membrane protein
MTTTHLLLRTIHISMGLLALASGAASMLLAKGSRLHARAGTVFFVAMLVMATSGASLAAFISPNVGNVMGGLLALYLTLTAWTTVWRAPSRTGRLEIAGALLGAATALLGISSGLRAMSAPTHLLEGYSPKLYFAFGSVALIGTLLDVRMLAHGGFAGAARTTRHLTRMCLAMFMATSSFFLGQAKLFPPAVRESGVLRVPVLLVVAGLLYSLVRIQLWPRLRRWRVARPAAGVR